MNELPELDELVQVGLFNILEERDVQIRGYPIRFEVDVCVLFSANPATYNRSGKVIPQGARSAFQIILDLSFKKIDFCQKFFLEKNGGVKATLNLVLVP